MPIGNGLFVDFLYSANGDFILFSLTVVVLMVDTSQ